MEYWYDSFNPCCDGLYKRTNLENYYEIYTGIVSILVVMDYIKELQQKQQTVYHLSWSFNPCCDGLYKRT